MKKIPLIITSSTLLNNRTLGVSNRWTHSGFTLVETLVAIAIIMTAITGPYAAAVQTINASRIAREHTVATFLAQEGIEAVRAERDKVYLHDCFTATGCSSSTVWWNGGFASASAYGTHAIGSCTSTSPCILDTSKSNNYSNYTNNFFDGMFLRQSSLPAPPLRLDQSPSSVPFLYDYVSAVSVTPFTRIIYSNIISNKEIKITSKVTWSDNGKAFTVTATDHFTPWFTQ